MRAAAFFLACWPCAGLAVPPDAPWLHAESAARVGAAMGGVRRANGPAVTLAGASRVYVVVAALTREHRAALEAAGLAIELPPPGTPAPRWRGGVVVQGRADAAGREALRALPFVVRLEEPGTAWTNVGSVTTAGDSALRSAAARDVLGTDGTGAVVGVISDGVDDRTASIASGDLPADVTLPVPALGSGAGNEGTALLEIVHDVAPGARLLFAPAATSAEMLSAIDGLAGAGAHVIVDDIVFTDEPKFEDGPVAVAARDFAAAGGVYVTAAGNFARAHYYATYRRGGAATFSGFTYPALHTFADGDFGNGLRIPAGAEVLVVLQWNDAFGRAGDDFDLVLARSASGGDVVLAAATAQQAGSGDPLETLRWTNASGAAVDAYLAIAEFARVTDVANLRFDIRVFSRATVPLQYVVARESVFGHAAVEEVLSVAAADVATPTMRESFSSLGPATIFFPAGAMRQVPRLTGVDGVATAVGRRGRFAHPFFGTSAAAPHVAGCAALLRAAGASAAATTSSMLATAIDLDSPGFDTMTGAGRLDCASAARLASGRGTPPVIDTLAAGFDPTGAVRVDVTGQDADGDTDTAVVRLFDGDGGELAADTDAVTANGSSFRVALLLRRSTLAPARGAAVHVVDALGFTSSERSVPITCPADGSLGDALCLVGDVLAQLDASPSPRRRALIHSARATATALVRAGRAIAKDRPKRAKPALTAASTNLGTLIRRTRRSADLAPILTTADALRTRIRTLRANL